MNIGREIVQELLEGTEKTVAIYGGGFKPPTKGHFEVAKLALEKHPNIDELIIYVGSGVRDGVTQQQSVTIWNIYKTKLSDKVQIITPDVPPVRAVLRYAKDNPDTKVIWILGAREDREEDFTDIAKRTKSIAQYPNLTVEVISTQGGISGTAARQALNSSKEDFFQFLPDEVGQQKNDIYDILTDNQFEESFVPGPLVHESKILKESFTPQKAPLMKRFVDFACEHLDINEPKIIIINSPEYTQEHHSFGGYFPHEQKINVVVHNRNMADILRTLAHELVHHMQNINGDELNGEDGSDTENEANAMAGVIMREFGRENPEIFESKINEAYFDTGKFSFIKPLSSHFIKALHEVTLNSSNAVELNGNITEGTFKVGDKAYEYNIKPFPNPYNDGGTFYNVGFNPIENKINIPTKDTPSKNYLKILSTMYKVIMDFIEQNKPDYLGISSIDNPEGKDYHTIYASLTDNKANRIPGYFRKDTNLLFKTPTGSGRIVVMKKKQPTPSLDEIKDQVISCENCGWEWDLADGGNDPYVCHKCGHDNTEEYDVENEQDLKEFVSFLKEYTKQLSESKLTEAEYHGHKVTLGKIMQGDIKKFKVYVKNNKGKVVKVNFGFGGSSAHGKRMNIKVHNPKRRAAYRARHNCANPGPRWKANYWSCRKW